MEFEGESAATEPGSAKARSTRVPRLFIKEMVMRNFKSYAGEQRVGPFHKVRVRCPLFLLFRFVLRFIVTSSFRCPKFLEESWKCKVMRRILPFYLFAKLAGKCIEKKNRKLSSISQLHRRGVALTGKNMLMNTTIE